MAKKVDVKIRGTRPEINIDIPTKASERGTQIMENIKEQLPSNLRESYFDLESGIEKIVGKKKK